MLPRLIRTTSRPVYYNANNLFGNSYPHYAGECDSEKNNSPAVNISQDENAYHLEMAIPGLSKKDLKISIDKDVLEVKFEHVDNEEGEGQEYLRREFTVQPFTKRYLLPETVNQDNIKANFKNGVLKLEVPKVIPVKQAAKEIEIV